MGKGYIFANPPLDSSIDRHVYGKELQNADLEAALVKKTERVPRLKPPLQHIGVIFSTE